jgi:hypothetical protein
MPSTRASAPLHRSLFPFFGCSLSYGRRLGIDRFGRRSFDRQIMSVAARARRGASLSSISVSPAYVGSPRLVKRFVPITRRMRHTCIVSQREQEAGKVSAPIARDVRFRVRMLAVRTAEHLARTHQYDAAADILENYLSVHGAEAEIMRLLGGIRLQQGRARDAAILLERALSRHFECEAVRRAARRAAEPAETEAAADAPAEEDPRQLRMDLPINITA